MNFFRQHADAFLQAQQHKKDDENNNNSEAAKAKPKSKSKKDKNVVSEPPEDPEMDAAIEEMKERLSNLRAQTTLQRMRNEREMQQLRTKHQAALDHVKDTVDTLIQKLYMAPYLAATKQVQHQRRAKGSGGETGVVVTLQAQLCMHIHGMCCHQEQLVLLKQDNSEVIFWYEDMVKQLRRDQADQEMNLMNQLVQTKIHIGELVDAKKLKERRRLSESQRGGSSFRTLNRKISRSTSGHKSYNNNNNAKKGNNSIGGMSLKQARMRGLRRGGSNNAQRQQQQQKPQEEEEVTSPMMIVPSGGHRRMMRRISKPGMALQKEGSMRNLNLQKSDSIRNLKNFTVPDHGEEKQEQMDDNSCGNLDNSWNSEASPGTSPVSVRKVHRLASESNNKRQQRGSATSTQEMPSPPSTSISATQKEVVAQEERTLSIEQPEQEPEVPTSLGLAPPSEEIAARRAARAEARRTGRPIRRGVQRTRSRSLTSMGESIRGSNRKTLSQQSQQQQHAQDDTDVSRRSKLLVGFPERRQSQDDSNSMMKRRGSTRELLRGFSPQPVLAAPDSPGAQAHSSCGNEDSSGGGKAEEEGSGFASAFKSWVGNVTVLLQQPADVGLSSKQHKLTLVG